LTGIYFGGSKSVKKRIPEDSFLSLCFPEELFTGMWFWRGLRNSCFLLLSQEFFAGIPAGQELTDSSGFFRIPLDSSRFLFPPNAVLLWPATKVGFLLS
jgi:hypothetical protein